MSATCQPIRARSFATRRKVLRAVDAVTRASRRLWRSKAAAELAYRAGSSTRSAENWLAGAASPSADYLAELIRSDAGFDVLDELMTGAQAQWWCAVRVRVCLAELDRRSCETRRSLEELKHAVADMDQVEGLLAVRMGS